MARKKPGLFKQLLSHIRGAADKNRSIKTVKKSEKKAKVLNVLKAAIISNFCFLETSPQDLRMGDYRDGIKLFVYGVSSSCPRSLIQVLAV